MSSPVLSDAEDVAWFAWGLEGIAWKNLFILVLFSCYSVLRCNPCGEGEKHKSAKKLEITLLFRGKMDEIAR